MTNTPLIDATLYEPVRAGNRERAGEQHERRLIAGVIVGVSVASDTHGPRRRDGATARRLYAVSR